MKDKNGDTALNVAAFSGHLDILIYLIEEKHCYPECPDKLNQTLYFACIIGNLSVVRYLVEEKGGKCDFHYQDALGFIPLDAATSSNNASVIEYMKE